MYQALKKYLKCNDIGDIIALIDKFDKKKFKYLKQLLFFQQIFEKYESWDYDSILQIEKEILKCVDHYDYTKLPSFKQVIGYNYDKYICNIRLSRIVNRLTNIELEYVNNAPMSLLYYLVGCCQDNLNIFDYIKEDLNEINAYIILTPTLTTSKITFKSKEYSAMKIKWDISEHGFGNPLNKNAFKIRLYHPIDNEYYTDYDNIYMTLPDKFDKSDKSDVFDASNEYVDILTFSDKMFHQKKICLFDENK